MLVCKPYRVKFVPSLTFPTTKYTNKRRNPFGTLSNTWDRLTLLEFGGFFDREANL